MAQITIGRRLNQATDSVTAAQGAAGSVPWPTRETAQLVPVEFDEVLLAYTGDDVTTATYKKSGVTVATLSLTYASGKLTRVVRA